MSNGAMVEGTELALHDGERAIAPGVAAGRAWLMPPQNLTEAMNAAKLLANSNFVPKDYRDKPGDVLCAIQFGAEVGLPPLQALQGIAVVNGRPTVWGDAAMALVLASGRCEDFSETLEGDGDNLTAVCRAVRRGREAAIEHRFGVADAKKANLWGKQGPWAQYPKRMLQMRARAFVLRDGFADVLKGLAIREEVADYDTRSSTATAGRSPQSSLAGANAAAVGEEAASKGVQNDGITKAQQRALFDECGKQGIPLGELKAWLANEGVESTATMSIELYDRAMAWVMTPQREPGAEG